MLNCWKEETMGRGKVSRDTLLKLAEELKAKTERDYVNVRAKRAARKAAFCSEKSETSQFERPREKVMCKMTLEESALSNKPKPGQTETDVVNWYHVQSWFIHGILRNNPDWLVVKVDSKRSPETQTMWVWPEKNCAERLLKHYGKDVVEKTVAWFCDNWQGIMDASNGRLGGGPSVKLLWVSRERFFAEAKQNRIYKPGFKGAKKRRKHMVGEYDANADSKMPDIGWGDV